jgi:hypothetical protein
MNGNLVILILGFMAILTVVAVGTRLADALRINAEAARERAKRWNGEPRTCCCKGHDCNGK